MCECFFFQFNSSQHCWISARKQWLKTFEWFEWIHLERCPLIWFQLSIPVRRRARSSAFPAAVGLLSAVRMPAADADAGSGSLFLFRRLDQKRLGRTAGGHQQHGFRTHTRRYLSSKYPLFFRAKICHNFGRKGQKLSQVLVFRNKIRFFLVFQVKELSTFLWKLAKLVKLVKIFVIKVKNWRKFWYFGTKFGFFGVSG